MPRVYAPDEEISFHFTASEINAIIAMVETTLTFPLRMTAPLREKILNQLNAGPLPDADVNDERVKPLVVQPITSQGTSRARKH